MTENKLVTARDIMLCALTTIRVIATIDPNQYTVEQIKAYAKMRCDEIEVATLNAKFNADAAEEHE